MNLPDKVENLQNSSIVAFTIMNWSEQFKLDKPGHLADFDSIDSAIFSELAHSYPNVPSALETWERGNDLHNKNVPLLRILSSVTESLCEYVYETKGKAPVAIGHSVRTRAVASRTAQTFGAGYWHADGQLWEPRPIVFMAASNFTTEFLLPGSNADGFREIQQLRRSLSTQNLFDNQGINEGLEQDLFATTKLAPYEGVVTEGNIHRSPTNYTSEAIHRTFFLLWVKSEQWLS